MAAGRPRDRRSTGNTLDTQKSIGSARQRLIEGLDELEIAARPQQIEALLDLASLLAQWSQRMNLTAHRSLEGIVQRLLLESAALGAQFGPVASLADIGSGAGFPGLPIAVLWPETRVTLVEPRRKRHHFQRAAVRGLGLANVAPRLGRSEALRADPHAAVIAQALAPPERALEWMLYWAEEGGLVLLPGSDSPSPVPERSDVEFVTRVHYRVPCGGLDRTLWIGRRRGD